MEKRVLFAFPDYSHTCLRSVKLFAEMGYQVDIVVAYNYRFIPRFFGRLSSPTFTKFYRRRALMDQLMTEVPMGAVNVIHLSFMQFCISFYKGYFVRKRPFFNILKDMIQEDICPKINYSKYNLLYLFDTVAYLFQEKAIEHGIKTILECRGPHFKFSQDLRLALEAEEKGEKPKVYTPKDENDEWWYRKLITEPEMADYLICYSEFHAQQYIDNSSKKLEQVYLLPLPSTIQKSNVTRKYNGSHISFYFAGNITSLKGINQLLKAWKSIQSENDFGQSISLHIYGSCSEVSYLEEFKLMPSIHYHGKQLHHELIKAISQHDVCIFPSLLDSYGFALQEALQLNIPVVSNYTSGASFLYEHAVHGYKCNDSYNTLELASYVNQFINNPNLIEEFSAALNQLPDYNANYMNTLGKKNIEKLFEEIA